MTLPVVLFGFSALFLFVTAFAKRDIFSPIFLYLTSFAVSLGIYHLELSEDFVYLQPLTWVVIAGSSLAFVLGCISVRFFFYSKENNPIPQVNPKFSFRSVNWPIVRVITFGFVGLLLLSFLRMYSEIGAIPILSDRIEELVSLDSGINIGYWNYILTAYPLVLMLLFPSTIKKYNPTWNRWLFRIFFILLFALSFMFYLSRSSLMVTLFFMTVLYNFSSKRLGIKFVFLGVAGVIAIFVFAGSAKKQFTLEQREILIKLPYQYVANGFWNLDYALNSKPDKEVHPHTYGTVFFRGLMEINPMYARIRSNYKFDTAGHEKATKHYGLNTIAYQWNLYKDFGMFGIIFIPYFVGLFIYWLYMQVKITSRLDYLVVYGVLSGWTALAFWADFWTYPGIPYWPLILFIVYHFGSQKGKYAEIASKNSGSLSS